MLSHKNNLAAVLLSVMATGSAYAQITESAAKDATTYTDSVLSKMPEPSLLGGFGAFDTPIDKASVNFTNLNQKGSLGKLGVSAMDKCKNYVPTGNVAQDQECAGINYMANNCLQTNSTQNQIITGVPNVPTGASNCSGTYGSTAGSFELSPSDKMMFSNLAKATSTLSATTDLCAEVEKIVRPATTEIFSCVKNTSYTKVACTQDLVAEVSRSCRTQDEKKEWSPPTGPTGRPLSTYDDFRKGPQSVCNILWPGSTVVSSACAPAPESGFNLTARGCDYRHNGSWGWSPFCADQGWCNGGGISYVSCSKKEEVCDNVANKSWADNCTVYEASSGIILGNPE